MVERKDTMVLDMPLDQAYLFCQERLEGLPRFRLQISDNNGSVLRLLTGISWKTFGDEIILTPEAISPTRTLINIVSRTNGPQIYDWGSNMTNILQIKEALEQARHQLLRPSHNSKAGQNELLRAVTGGNREESDSLLRASNYDE